MISIDGDRLLADLRALAQFGKAGTGVNRLAFSAEDIAARDWLRQRMVDAGLEAEIDGVGNVYGRTPEVAKTVLIGSHTDTVPKGGWLDGAMGVLYGLEVARSRIEAGGVDGGVDVISFADEEGTYSGTLGSRSFVGEVGGDEMSTATSIAGETLTAALARAGYDKAAPARLDAARHVAYLEGHIEQGPRLEAAGERIGIVTGIVGMRRMTVTFQGQADHAGTTPMAMRKDAGAALLDLVAAVRAGFERVKAADTVWNFGFVSFLPGAGNVVPAEAEVLIEYRDADTAVLDQMEAEITAAVEAIDTAGTVSAAAARTMAVRPAHMDRGVGDQIAAAAEALGVRAVRMPSGAGHDAMHLAEHVRTGMLFIPSIGGRSHDISEDTSEADIILGCRVLAGAVARLLG